MKHYFIFTLLFSVLFSCNNKTKKTTDGESGATKKSEVHYTEEKHLTNVKQLTFGGDNAEAYFSFDDSKLVFQLKNPEVGIDCDQIYILDYNTHDMKKSMPPMVSTGLGRTTCSYFMPGDSTVIYASTHLGDKECPVEPEKREDGAYVWPIYADFDIFVANMNGDILQQLTKEPGYDAEATVSPQGDKIVFTSDRTGDLELYTMEIDGSNVNQVTFGLGYDGGAFFSPDGTKLIFRSSRPKSDEEIKAYKDLLAEGLVEPTEMELYICNSDGSNLKKLTNLGNANWSPFFHPSGEKILFSSNFEAERGFPFNLYMIDLDGKNLKRITHGETFDAFPVFSNDGKWLAFSSNRNNGGGRDTNLFIAEWQE